MSLVRKDFIEEDSPLASGAAYRPERVCRRRRAGLSLIEVVAATCVLALALTTSIVVLQIGFRDVDVARTGTVVSQVMQSEVERLRALNWDGILALPESETVDLTEAHSSEAIAGGRLTVTRTVSDVAGFVNMKEIRIAGVWTAINGMTHTRTLIMRYGKGGLYDYYYGVPA